MYRSSPITLLLPCLLLGVAATCPIKSATGETAEHAVGEEHFHRNVVGVFGGITHEGRRENDPALGVEYERRISESFGIGALAEYTSSEDEFWVFAVPFAFHTGPWKLYLAPGVEDSEHGTEHLVRLGVEYAFDLSGGWEIAPQIDLDLVDGEEVWVFGLVFARGF